MKFRILIISHLLKMKVAYYFLSVSLADIFLLLTLSLVKKDICETYSMAFKSLTSFW